MAKATAAEKPTVNIPRDVVITLMRAADRVRRSMIRTLQEFELTMPQFNVLIILRFEQELPTLEVAARLVEETPGITRLMNTLAAKKYIRRRQCRNDRRQQLCSLTDAGQRLIDEVIPVVKATQERIVGGLNRRQAAEMMIMLDRLAR